MKDILWIVIGPDGVHRTRKTKPPVGPNEFAIKLALSAEDKLFAKPSFESTIEIGPNQNITLEIKELEEQISELKQSKK
jgi:hypothetical protein